MPRRSRRVLFSHRASRASRQGRVNTLDQTTAIRRCAKGTGIGYFWSVSSQLVWSILGGLIGLSLGAGIVYCMFHAPQWMRGVRPPLSDTLANADDAGRRRVRVFLTLLVGALVIFGIWLGWELPTISALNRN
jgi:hypothetical protein